jgi:hypothetical protein
MGCMSASDAAPLPRLGEVFFDVRGSSRSMRLSWYSDTGVAVFSIWQGGTCTGTFRLPIDDLPRMVEALQRGPRAATPPAADARDAGGGNLRRSLPGGTDPAMPPVASFPDYATGQNMSMTPATGEFRAPGPDDMPQGFDNGPDFGGRRGAGEPRTSSIQAVPPYGEQTGPGGYGGDPPSYPGNDAPYGGDPLGSGGYRQQEPPGYRDRGPTGPGGPSAPSGPEPAFPPSYPDDGPAYRDSGPPGYRDDPLGPGGYGGDPPSYPGNDAPYGGDPLGSGGYRQQEPPGYRDDPYLSPYRDEPMGYPDERNQRYTDDPFQSVYPEDTRRGYADDPRPGSHPYGDPRDRDSRDQRAPRGRP